MKNLKVVRPLASGISAPNFESARTLAYSLAVSYPEMVFLMAGVLRSP